MYIILIIIWLMGMIIYILLNNVNNYNNKKYLNVKNNIKKFKNVRDTVYGINKTIIK